MWLYFKDAKGPFGGKRVRQYAVKADIRGFTGMLKHHAEKAPLRRNVELREVGDTGLFLASPMSSGITGEVIHVDCGYFVMGV